MRLKHSSGISAKWLGRCKPDLENLEAKEPQGERVQGSLDEEDVAFNGQNSQDGASAVSICQGQSSLTISSNNVSQLDKDVVTSEFDYWSVDDLMANGCYDTDSSSEDDPFLIKSTSAEQLDQKFNDFSNLGFSPTKSSSQADDVKTVNSVSPIVPSTMQHEQIHSRSPLHISSTKCQSEQESTNRDATAHEVTLSTITATNEHIQRFENGNDGGDRKVQTTTPCCSRGLSLSGSPSPSQSNSGLSMLLEVCAAKSQTAGSSSSSNLLLSKSVMTGSKFAKSRVSTKNTKQWRVHRDKQDANQEAMMMTRSREHARPMKYNKQVIAVDKSSSTNTQVGRSQFENQSELHLEKNKTCDDKVLSKPAIKTTGTCEYKGDALLKVNKLPNQTETHQSDIMEEEFLSELEVLSEQEKDVPIISRGKDASKANFSDSNTNGDEEDTGSEMSDDSHVSKKPEKSKKSSLKSTSSTSRGSAVSDNFIRLNMKVKRFSRRPGRGITGSAHKRLAWKKMQKSRGGSFGGGGSGSGSGKGGRSGCFKCGNPGHWARNCTASAGSKNLGKFDGEKVGFSDKMATGDEGELDEATLQELSRESPFPTVEDAAMMAQGIKFGSRREFPEDVSEQTRSLEGDVRTIRSESESQDGEGDSERTLHHFIVPPPCHIPTVVRTRSVDPLFPTVDGKITSKCVYMSHVLACSKVNVTLVLGNV